MDLQILSVRCLSHAAYYRVHRLVPPFIVIQVWEQNILFNSFGQGCHCLVVLWNDLRKEHILCLECFSVDSKAPWQRAYSLPFWHMWLHPPLCKPLHWRLLSVCGPSPQGSLVGRPPHRVSLIVNCWPSADSESALPLPTVGTLDGVLSRSFKLLLFIKSCFFFLPISLSVFYC